MNNELTAALLTIEKSKEATGCPAGLDLQDWVKQLADELNAERAWESVVMEVCGEDGQESVAAVINALTALAAENAALKEDRDTLARYWIEDGGDKDCAMSYCEPTPATDRIVAWIKADAAAPLVSALKVIANSEQHNGDTVVCDFDTLISVASGALRDYYAKQLREGADK
ncbi:hypothetical protein ACRFL2_14160 [Klebsiella aerogenes]|uniref:hypothetical protein n=1 Tax=Klebsiella aerogenes TaxID=548 RepID=UPI003D6CF208